MLNSFIKIYLEAVKMWIKEENIYKFLMGRGFKKETLDLLTQENLNILATQYCYDAAYKTAVTK